MLDIDVVRARAVARQLLEAYAQGGIFGNQNMPEDLVPPGVVPGSEEHLRFITLTVAIDYMRDADQLWNAARASYADAATSYLFLPEVVAQTGLIQLIQDMQRYRLSRKHQKDAQIWQSICTTLVTHFDGQVGTLLDRAERDALKLLALIRSPRYRSGFPNVKGEKIGPLWIRMLHDNCLVNLDHLGEVPLPVDIHTAQATLQTGCIRPSQLEGSMGQLRKAVQQVWKEASALAADGTYPLRLDEPLWLLSRQGCRKTPTWPCAYRERCPVVEYCQPNRIRLSVAGDPNQQLSEWNITLDSPRLPGA